MDISPGPEVLHRLPEDGVVLEFVEVALELCFGLCPHPGVEGDVRGHPGLLLELEDLVDAGKAQPLAQGELQVPVVDPVLGLVAEVRHELLAGDVLLFSEEAALVGAEPLPGHLHALGAKRIVVVRLVELVRVVEVDAEESPLFRIIRELGESLRRPCGGLPPSEASHGQALAHGPAVEVGGVVVAQPRLRLAEVVAGDPRVVRLGVAPADGADTAA